MSSFQQEVMRCVNKQNMAYSQEKIIETVPEEAHAMDLLDQ